MRSMAQQTKKQEELDRIAAEISQCRMCKRNKIGMPVPGEGNPDADVVFIGEAPGKLEAETGRPFVGRAGKLLREMIRNVGLKEEDVFITSPVKFLPKHITPTPQEIAHGRKHLFAQFDVIEPKLIVLLGRVASLAVLEKDVKPSKEHGTVIKKDGRTYFITYHPAAMLHGPKAKEPMMEDFRKLRRMLQK